MSTSRSVLRRDPWPRRIRNALLFVFAVIPLTFPPFGFLGYNLSGWLWLTEIAIIAPLVLREPLHRRTARYLMPYSLFLLYAITTLPRVPNFRQALQWLIQLALPALAYVLAWRAPQDGAIRKKLSVASRWGLGIAAILYAGGFVFPGTFGFGPISRPASLSLVALFVVATLDSNSWRLTLFIGAVALTLTIAAGGRAATALLVIMLLTSPSLGVRWRGRIIIACACLLLVLVGSNTPAFKQRFFFNEGYDSSLLDVLTVSGNVNTAGRRELWPELVRECSPADVTGLGIGASSALSLQLSDGSLDQPHNDYLRIYCDVGMFGSVAFWTFFVWAGVRSWRGALTGPDHPLHAAAGQLVLALLLSAITDNPILYTALFTVPIGVVLGLSDRALTQGRTGLGDRHPRAQRADTASLGPSVARR
jgi:O-antigen ligase